MITLTITPPNINNYILPELSPGPNIHVVITKPRTSTENIHAYVAPLYSEIMKRSNNPQDQANHTLPLSVVKGSTYARSIGLASKFIGLNPISISTQQKFCSRFINYDSIKKNGFKLITSDQLKNMTYLRNSSRENSTIIYILKTRDILSYEILKKLETNQHLLPRVNDIYRIAQFINVLINQNTPDLFREPATTKNI